MNLETFLKILNIPLNNSIDEILDMLIIYLRKSRKDMEYYKDESIEKTLQRHEKELQDFIINIFGKPIPEYNIYREVASGDTIDDRPVMQEVLSLIENKNIKGVICIEIERLARGNTMDQGIIAQTFQYSNTKIITPMKIYCLDNEDDLTYFEDGLYQARKYLKYVKRILNRGRIRSVKDGKYIGSVIPYGSDKLKLPNEKGFMLIQNEAESKTTKLMADLFLNGLNTTYTVSENDTISTIAKIFGTKKSVIINNNLDLKINTPIKLTVNYKSVEYKIQKNDTLDRIAENYNIDINKIHIPNDLFKNGETLKIIIDDMRSTNIAHYFNYLKIKPRKSKEWTANMIRNILKSPTIYGYVTWDRRKTIKTLENGKIKKSNPYNDNYLFIKGKHYDNSILNEDTRIKIEEKFKRNKLKTIPNNKELKNPLVGLVSCGYCGNNMTRRPYYITKNTKPTTKRVYDIDKTKLRLLLRNHIGNYTFRDIANALKVTRNSVANWFANSDNRFSIPRADKWYDLKKLLNIKTTEFDKAITTFEETGSQRRPDILMCSRPRCKCVASDLDLVEDRILKSLKIIKEEYKTYINNYEEEVKKENTINKDMLITIEREIDKIKLQIEKVCELVETGAYTQDLFLKRTNILNEQLEALSNQKKELLKKDTNKDFYIKKKSIPILEDILSKYSNKLTPEEKNALLSSIIKQVIYKKEHGGRYLKDNFTLKIILLSFD